MSNFISRIGIPCNVCPTSVEGMGRTLHLLNLKQTAQAQVINGAVCGCIQQRMGYLQLNVRPSFGLHTAYQLHGEPPHAADPQGLPSGPCIQAHPTHTCSDRVLVHHVKTAYGVAQVPDGCLCVGLLMGLPQPHADCESGAP